MYTNISEKDVHSQLHNRYSYMDSVYCDIVCEELFSLESNFASDETYSGPLTKLLRAWLLGRTSYGNMDVLIRLPSRETEPWSVVELAEELDTNYPNIPVAIMLLDLAMQAPLLGSAIMSKAGEFCLADHRLSPEVGEECVYAELSETEEMWYFFAEQHENEPTDVSIRQLWQVLLSESLMAPLIAFDHPLGTVILKETDGSYTVTHVNEL